MQHDTIIILDFGSQYSHLIARRIREFNVYCELHSCLVSLDVLLTKPIKGIVLSGSPSSINDSDAPHMSPAIWDYIESNNIPLLGICYGLQEIVYKYGGEVEATKKREYGKAIVNKLDHTKTEINDAFNLLFGDIQFPFEVWMSHGDKLLTIPKQFHDICNTINSEHCCIVHESKMIYGIQFHPEVTHTPQGSFLLRNFAFNLCHCKSDWNMGNFIEESINKIKDIVGTDGHVIGAVSGGVDSSVAALLLQRAIGNRFHAILVDNGLLRKNEASEVMTRMQKEGIDLTCVDASDRFLEALSGVDDPEKKRKVIGHLFIDVFEDEADKISKKYPVEFLLQGTLYPDVIESISYKGPSVTIKSHHNVGGLKENMKLKLIEPLRELFKDEVRLLGLKLGLDQLSINRHPFPGPGLAIRCIGDIKKEYLDIIREADSILIEELVSSNEYYKIGQALCVLLPVRSVGVMGDCRTYEKVIALRMVQTTDYMTADWYKIPYDLLGKISNRIINEVHGVNRVVYDVSSKPPSTIEWE